MPIKTALASACAARDASPATPPEFLGVKDGARPMPSMPRHHAFLPREMRSSSSLCPEEAGVRQI